MHDRRDDTGLVGDANSRALVLAGGGAAGNAWELGLIAGLCDAGEEADFRLALARAGLGADLERAGFHVCDADLEDELIRCLGAERVVRIVEAQGELGRLRTFQNQPAQRTRSVEAQLRRFMGTRGGRKIQYAPLLVGALDLARVPPPLDGVLAHVP